jgi:Zn-dependent peptidase ImmA (M78 family)/transcriptional regulator with XRE-family HTH domain
MQRTTSAAPGREILALYPMQEYTACCYTQEPILERCYRDMSANLTFPIGPRVKFAREKAGFTQEALAEAMDFNDRQTISFIETGARALKAEELARLCDVLDEEMEFFLNPFDVSAEAQYSWRASDSLSGEDLDRFQSVANGWVGMLRWLNRQSEQEQSSNDFLGLRLSATSTYEQALSYGERMARYLEVGPIPAALLAEVLGPKLGIEVLFVDAFSDLPRHSISGAACQVDGINVILINRRESAGRRNFDLAHELFHALTWQTMPPNHRESNGVEDRAKVKRVEQLANNFASALLMPRSSVELFFEASRGTDIQHLADVAEKLQVTTDALGWRLKNLGLINEVTRVGLALMKRPEDTVVPKLFSKTFVSKLNTALDKGRLSARKAAKTLGMSLSQLTNLFHEYNVLPPFEL